MGDEDEVEDQDEEDGHKDYCEISGEKGELVMCDFCDYCYLPECLGVERAEDLPDPYRCPKCCGPGQFEEVKAAWKKKRLDDALGPSDEDDGMSGDEDFEEEDDEDYDGDDVYRDEVEKGHYIFRCKGCHHEKRNCRC